MKTNDEILYDIVCTIELMQTQIENLNRVILLLNKRIDEVTNEQNR